MALHVRLIAICDQLADQSRSGANLLRVVGGPKSTTLQYEFRRGPGLSVFHLSESCFSYLTSSSRAICVPFYRKKRFGFLAHEARNLLVIANVLQACWPALSRTTRERDAKWRSWNC